MKKNIVFERKITSFNKYSYYYLEFKAFVYSKGVKPILNKYVIGRFIEAVKTYDLFRGVPRYFDLVADCKYYFSTNGNYAAELWDDKKYQCDPVQRMSNLLRFMSGEQYDLLKSYLEEYNILFKAYMNGGDF